MHASRAMKKASSASLLGSSGGGRRPTCRSNDLRLDGPLPCVRERGASEDSHEDDPDKLKREATREFCANIARQFKIAASRAYEESSEATSLASKELLRADALRGSRSMALLEKSSVSACGDSDNFMTPASTTLKGGSGTGSFSPSPDSLTQATSKSSLKASSCGSPSAKKSSGRKSPQFSQPTTGVQDALPSKRQVLRAGRTRVSPQLDQEPFFNHAALEALTSRSASPLRSRSDRRSSSRGRQRAPPSPLLSNRMAVCNLLQAAAGPPSPARKTGSTTLSPGRCDTLESSVDHLVQWPFHTLPATKSSDKAVKSRGASPAGARTPRQRPWIEGEQGLYGQSASLSGSTARIETSRGAHTNSTRRASADIADIAVKDPRSPPSHPQHVSLPLASEPSLSEGLPSRENTMPLLNSVSSPRSVARSSSLRLPAGGLACAMERQSPATRLSSTKEQACCHSSSVQHLRVQQQLLCHQPMHSQSQAVTQPSPMQSQQLKLSAQPPVPQVQLCPHQQLVRTCSPMQRTPVPHMQQQQFMHVQSVQPPCPSGLQQLQTSFTMQPSLLQQRHALVATCPTGGGESPRSLEQTTSSVPGASEPVIVHERHPLRSLSQGARSRAASGSRTPRAYPGEESVPQPVGSKPVMVTPKANRSVPASPHPSQSLLGMGLATGDDSSVAAAAWAAAGQKVQAGIVRSTSSRSVSVARARSASPRISSRSVTLSPSSLLPVLVTSGHVMNLDPSDPMDKHLLEHVKDLHAETVERLKICKLGPARYEIDGRPVRLSWGRGKSVSRSLAASSCLLVVEEKEGEQGDGVDLSFYISQAANVAANLRGASPGASAIGRIPQEMRLTFNAEAPLAPGDQCSQTCLEGISSDARRQLMRQAVAEAHLRHHAAEETERNLAAAHALGRSWTTTTSQASTPGFGYCLSHSRSQQLCDPKNLLSL
eukprot:TRINITY_DN61605_c0_g1_i1.p1 TRINITY_DN61605_c0_g1~~TRINITY_DN61605_c0_g1_i1.p1  ORF type:complete len:942 (-),score=119.16 TRINITY_DN61605_c0_g1_i1:113-2938(-)